MIKISSSLYVLILLRVSQVARLFLASDPSTHLTMCGIIGLVYTAEKNCTQALVDGLTVLQHRGQDAAGIVTIRDNRLNLRKDLGTVAEVFNQDNVLNLQGNVGIGHVRYPTAGC